MQGTGLRGPLTKEEITKNARTNTKLVVERITGESEFASFEMLYYPLLRLRSRTTSI